jgi:hypothetical protein
MTLKAEKNAVYLVQKSWSNVLVVRDEYGALGRWQPDDGPTEEIAKVGSLCLVKTTRFLKEEDSSRREESGRFASESLVKCPDCAKRVWSSETLAAKRWANRSDC